MRSSIPMRTFAAVLALILIAPSILLVSPQKAKAIPVTETGANLLTNIKTTFESTITAIKTTLIEAHAYTTMVATEAQYINTYYLQPLAFVLSGNLLKSLTAGVISFVIGQTNGTGVPQFVQNVQGHMQMVGDTQALAFFVQFGRNSNSPFAAAISSSLRTNYLQNTSMAGFWAANRSTLPSNINLFLAGNWTQGGGTASWFALTTQTQNNPYLLYQASQSQLASVVAGATAARLAELNWGQGFLSWCGPASDPAASADSGSGTASDPASADNSASADSGSGTASDQASTDSSGAGGDSGLIGTAPGDACRQKDGTPGLIKTPGSTIKATLDKVLGSTQDKLVQMGQLAKEVGGILGDVGTVLSTVNFAANILGNASLNSASAGLFGSGQTSASNPRSQLMQYQSAPGYLGVTPSTVSQNAAALPASGSDKSSQLNQYESSWNAIRTSATAAAATVTDTANFCTAAADAVANGNSNSNNAASFVAASRAAANSARTALTMVIAPVLARADTATRVITAARAMIVKVQNELNNGGAQQSAYIADLQTLQTMPPTGSDIGNAQQDAQAFGTAAASPDGSLNVSGGSLIDQMSLISTNAAALKTSVCTFSAQNGSTNTQGSD